MYNRSVIWASRPKNTEFRLVFATNWCFFGKTEGSPFDFDPKFEKKLKSIKTSITDYYI
jgi:hypothetical protein